ncbi:hypothetical protein AVEN_8958-1 [Araneus ventricosus]|uniref:Uncharacterized protein n=1 Tax=Araneus ventricosus TaxID=182803 RepID=A0A4Y2LN02_ARAVE|nr:hypothetical protein AVEN_8958-1 [Araneus ventricosus]
MRKPAPNFEQEWLKRVANNLVSRQKIRGIIKFITEENRKKKLASVLILLSHYHEEGGGFLRRVVTRDETRRLEALPGVETLTKK